MSLKYFKNYFLIILIFSLASVFEGENLFFVFYPCILCGIIPTNLLAYDERAKWDVYCGALPCSRDMVVTGKYIVGLIVQGLILVIVAVAQVMRMLSQGSLHWESLAMILGLVCLLGLGSTGLTLPFIFKLGVERGRMAYYIMIAIACGGSAIGSAVLQELGALEMQLPMGVTLLLLPLIAFAVYGISWYVSVRFYRKRELK